MPTTDHMPTAMLANLALAGAVDRLGQPLYFHALRAADNVAAAGHGDPAVEVALLHDVLEDSALTVDELRRDGVADDVIVAVEILTRGQDERGQDGGYRRYIQRIVDSQNRLAIAVKLDGDLADHLDPAYADGLTPGLKARYEDAQRVLRVAWGQFVMAVPKHMGPMPEPVSPPSGAASEPPPPLTYYPQF